MPERFSSSVTALESAGAISDYRVSHDLVNKNLSFYSQFLTEGLLYYEASDNATIRMM